MDLSEIGRSKLVFKWTGFREGEGVIKGVKRKTETDRAYVLLGCQRKVLAGLIIDTGFFLQGQICG